MTSKCVFYKLTNRLFKTQFEAQINKLRKLKFFTKKNVKLYFKN